MDGKIRHPRRRDLNPREFVTGLSKIRGLQNPKPYTLNPKPYTLHPKP